MHRRSFLMTLGCLWAAPAFASVLPISESSPVRIAGRTVTASRRWLNITLDGEFRSRVLAVKVSGSGLWIDAIGLVPEGGARVQVPIRRRLLPDRMVELPHVTGPVRQFEVSYSHLPLETGRTTIELWAV